MNVSNEAGFVDVGGSLKADYEPFGRLAVIPELVGYTDEPTPNPLWGEPDAIYNPITSSLTKLDSVAWSVLGAIAFYPDNSFARNVWLSSLERNKVETVVADLLKQNVIIPRGERPTVEFETPTARHELYIELTRLCNYCCKGCAVGIDQEKLRAQSRREEAEEVRPKLLPILGIGGEDERPRTTMSDDVLDTLLTNAARAGHAKKVENVHIKWAGGEPLMDRPFHVIQHGQEKIRQLREEYPSIDFTQVIITNGTYLTQEVVDQIKAIDDVERQVKRPNEEECGVLISVSLWGLGETHDKARGAHRERDKFPHVIEGIKRLHEAGITYNIHYVHTPDNAHEFGEFMEALWDIKSNQYLAKDWNWPEGPRPLPLTTSFYRPQEADELAMLNNGGHQRMVDGLRAGFKVIHNLITRGIPIKALDRIDYLQPFRVVPTVCGSGVNYAAVGPNGEIESCHEGLYGARSKLGEIAQIGSVMGVANQEYAGNVPKLIGANIAMLGIDETTATTLRLHGGTGCPRTAMAENGGELGNAASTARELYAPILREWIALEAMRRYARSRQSVAA